VAACRFEQERDQLLVSGAWTEYVLWDEGHRRARLHRRTVKPFSYHPARFVWIITNEIYMSMKMNSPSVARHDAHCATAPATCALIAPLIGSSAARGEFRAQFSKMAVRRDEGGLGSRLFFRAVPRCQLLSFVGAPYTRINKI
jgi:hypothetical protein